MTFIQTSEGAHCCRDREKVQKRFQDLKQYLEETLGFVTGENVDIHVINEDFERTDMPDDVNLLPYLSRDIMDISKVDYVIFDMDMLTVNCLDASILMAICEKYNVPNNSISLQHFDYYSKVGIGVEIKNYMIGTHKWLMHTTNLLIKYEQVT